MQATITPGVGQIAPEFKLRGPGGQFVTLSEYLGRKNVVLVFYPLAFSPVCANQLPGIQRQLSRFEALDAVVLGISVDSYYANEEFARRLGVEFPLLSDILRQASTAYGVLNAERGYSGRAVFIVDRGGRIAYADVSANAGDPAQVPDTNRVLAALEALR